VDINFIIFKKYTFSGMRRSYITLVLCAFLGLFLLSNSSCSKKTGCPVNERATVKVDKKGNPKKKSRSGVIPPGMRKKKKG